MLPDRTEDFTADPVELFFDLAYVFAYSQIVALLIKDPTWEGVGKAALLFGLIWLPWSQVTWTANAVSGNGRRVRALFLVATATSVPMAASVPSAYDNGGVLFAVSLVIIMLIGFSTMTLALDRGDDEYRSALSWIGVNSIGMVLLLAGAASEGDVRIALWVGTAAFVVIAMGLAGRGDWVIRSGHMAERHGLIVIIALGEIIVAVGLPVLDALEGGAGLPGKTLVSLMASGTLACLLWWSYFDRVGPALEHRAEALTVVRDRGRYVHDVYTGAHAAIVGGVIVSAAALEEIALHPGDEIPDNFSLMLVTGLGMFTAGIVIAVWRAYRVIAWERIAVVAVVAAVLIAGASLEGATTLVIIDLAVLVTLMLEHVRIER